MGRATRWARLLLAGLVGVGCGGKLLPAGTVTLASNQSSPSRVALDGTTIYWTNSGAAPVPSPDDHLATLLPPHANGAIMKAAISGGRAVTLAFTGADSPGAIAIAGG